jgi:hypothetical protein
MNRVATVHHTTDKVLDITCELGRELDLLTYGYRRVEPLRANTPLTRSKHKNKSLSKSSSLIFFSVLPEILLSECNQGLSAFYYQKFPSIH